MRKNKINIVLLEHIEKNIFPLYKKNDEGHNLEHIKYVINRSIELARDIEDIDYNMLYTIAAYHDIGHYIDRKNHEVLSAEIMRQDKALEDFFTKGEIKIMSDAIEDHRASLKDEPRNIYGKIVSSADREINIDTLIKRMYSYTKEHNPEYNIEQIIKRHFEHYKAKYGNNGYAKSYIKDEDYEKFIRQSNLLLKDYAAFYKRNIKVIEKIEKKKFISIEALLSLTTQREFTTMKNIEDAFIYITNGQDFSTKQDNVLIEDVTKHIYNKYPILEIITEMIKDEDLNFVFEIVEGNKQIHGSLFLMDEIKNKVKEL
jgi:uncharacterized protein